MRYVVFAAISVSALLAVVASYVLLPLETILGEATGVIHLVMSAVILFFLMVRLYLERKGMLER